MVQENAAVLAQRAKEQAVAASSSAYHSSKDATVQGLTVAGHHTAGATSGVVEGIQVIYRPMMRTFGRSINTLLDECLSPDVLFVTCG